MTKVSQICCIDCFGDSYLKYLIRSSIQQEETIKCEICGTETSLVIRRNDPIYQVVYEKLNTVWNCYRFASENHVAATTFREELEATWSVFSKKLNNSQSKNRLIQFFFHEKLVEENILTHPVELKRTKSDQLLLFNGGEFIDFENELKKERRFHLTTFNHDLFKKFVSYTEEVLEESERFYRARLQYPGSVLSPETMSAPPHEKASAGRANTKGISHLYLADCLETALKEVRAGLHNEVCVAQFQINKKLRIINLSKLQEISPFQLDENGMELELYAFNKRYLEEIVNAVKTPTRSLDAYLDYLSTQYIVDYLKSLGYDGVKYNSTMHEQGYNIVLFYPENAKLIEPLQKYQIQNIHYVYEKSK